ncbi:hypothetical protein KFE25_002543 [Diacronema lutheri]|uniref:Uncharacterized protein n=2 Tax=Diacronema lutheri TaxID=2081491 RepID=A0A8J5X602_DIALT|nr:hypothetical protein KFE25_002543 [Diacronema lutheri]
MAMPCGCQVPQLPTAESLNESIVAAKERAYDALDKVKDSFTELEAKLSEGISMDSVKTGIRSLSDKLQKMADDPSSVLGAAGCIASCIFPIQELGGILKDAAKDVGKIATIVLDGALDRIMLLVNEMISGLQGIGAALMTTMGALSEVGTLLGSLSGAFSGDAAAKLQVADEIEIFIDKADFKLTSKKIDQIFGSLGKLAKSADIEAVVVSVTDLAKFLAEIPPRIKKAVTPNACASMCISLPAALADLLDKMEAFGKMFNADAVTKALKFAQKNAGVSSSTLTAPLDGMDKTLRGAASALKLMAKTNQ